MSSHSRRDFLTDAAAVSGAGLLASDLANARQPAPLPCNAPPPLRFRLGIVTYNIAATWDLPTLLRICRAVGLSPVELRTTHRHGVEPTLNAQQRREVRMRFRDAGVEIWGCGTVCEFHSVATAAPTRIIPGFCRIGSEFL
jgi:hypothetical protein